MRRPSLRAAAATAAVSAMALTLAGCASGQAQVASGSPTDPGTIGLALPTTESARWISDGQNMVKQFQVLGYKTDLEYAQNDVQKQVGQVGAMIQHHVRALVIGSIDGTALKADLAQAKAAGIPVIAYDRLIRGSGDVDYYATFDNFKVGVLQGTALADAIGLKSATKAAPKRIELFAGSADDNNATFFFNGAMSVLKPYLDSGALVVPSGQMEFLPVTTKAWDGKVAGARMETLLAGPDAAVTLDGVLSPYDGISRAILTSLQAHGYGKGGKALPAVTGQDAELDSVKLVNTGGQSSTIYKDTRELAKVAVEMTDKLLNGEKPDINDTKTYDNGVKVVPTFLLQPVLVTKANLQTVLIGGGYYKASDLG
ncbi:putative multiple sugar transport system substrate-binding protein [Motilibacter rhizosphaerae]|uniref:Putative multiple sugar transport system substrate-binding protein n=1 Tax=Motilibacter rhizosphaerae TaxID=598652 RepID=A0A4Q7NUX0_9ACTN|nr:multiple monosaccharide ABC transporter substrate-binding protein [Motilibacter rhizosphaerae]RZS91011.1 putative multiple sugar transport system substrate-binding protein [Motilibacter rhizosphaerae]